MATEVWIRNPKLCIKEVVEVGHNKIAWDYGFLTKHHLDPLAHASLYFPHSIPYRLLLIGPQGSAEYRRGDKSPCAVFPTWAYGEDSSILEEFVFSNIGDNPDVTGDTEIPVELRPVVSQEHRVVITDLPALQPGPARKFLRYLQELQEEAPDCIIHLHGAYSYRIAFGMGFGAADMEVRHLAAKGKVTLPNGKEMIHERTASCPQWVTLLGMSPVDLAIPRNRCMFNIRSAIWAGKYYQENIKFKAKNQGGVHVVDTEASEATAIPATADTARVTSITVKTRHEGDKFLCDTCSLQTTCKYYRNGGVCSIPDSEPTSLAKYFKTRDSDMIIEGLGTLLATQTHRLERGLEEEDDFGELNPEVTKILNSLFANGVKLAKLVNPALQGGTKVGVFVNGGSAAVTSGTSPKAMVASVVAELEARGIPRDKITPDMIAGVLQPAMPERREAIDAEVIAESV